SGPNASMYKGGVNPYPDDSAPSTPTPPAQSGSKYTVKAGDTLSAIASQQKVSGGWQALYNANKSVIGSNPNLIFPGQVLTIPKATVKYTVQRGDSLSAVAMKYKVPGGWKALYDANKSVVGSNPDLIKPGMILIIPGGAAAPSAPAAPSQPSNPAPVTSGYVAPLAAGTYIHADRKS